MAGKRTSRFFILGAAATAAWFVAAFAGPALAAGNWTNYRGPGYEGHVDAADLPTEWSEEKNIAWKTEIAGKAWSTPVVWGDRIWLTNATQGGDRLSAVCIDKKSGKVIHNKRLHYSVAPQYCHPFNSYGSPSPVVEEGRVYVSFGSPYNACLDFKTGDVIWERTDFVCNHFRGPGSSPFLYEDLLILHLDGSDHQFIVAMDKITGDTVWKTERSVDFGDLDPKTNRPSREGDLRKAYSTPLIADVDGRPVLISLGSMALYGYDPRTGKELWRLENIGSHSGACRPVLGHGLIYSPMGSGGELFAVRPDGKGVLTDSHVVWSRKKSVPRRASLLLVDDLLFMVDDGGVASCVEAKTGEEVWKKRLGSNFSASPIYAGGLIYFFDQDGKSTVVEASKQYQVVATNELDEGMMASPAVSGDALFLRTRTHLYRIEKNAAN